MVTKKIPVRRCVGCNESKPKKELVRIVRSAEGEISAGAPPRLNRLVLSIEADLVRLRRGAAGRACRRSLAASWAR